MGEDIFDYTKELEEILDTGSITFYESKRNFRYEWKGKEFEYKIIVEVDNLAEINENEEGFSVEVGLVILPEYLHNEIREKVCISTFGTYEDKGLTTFDIYRYGLGAQIKFEEVEYRAFVYPEIQYVVDNIDDITDEIHYYLCQRWGLLRSTYYNIVERCLFNTK